MNETVKKLVEEFVSSNSTPKFIYRVNPYSSQIIEKIGVNKIKGILDWSVDMESHMGIPVIHDPKDVDGNAIVLNCVIHTYSVTVTQKLRKAGLRCIDLFDLMRYSDYRVSIPYWEGFYDSYQKNRAYYNEIYKKLSDDLSKKSFEVLLNLRLNFDNSHMTMFDASPANQYFEPFLKLNTENEVFVDLGGFDGENTEYFVTHYPGYKKVYYFEPEPTIMRDAEKRLSLYRDIKFFMVAASDKKEILHFSSDSAASKVSDKGGIEVQADCLDHLLERDVTFLKMDVEGSEAAAIEGSRDIIMKCHPKLAICIYHRGGDFVDIPRQVLSIRSDYDLYVRHYSEGICDTVMFFVPKQ